MQKTKSELNQSKQLPIDPATALKSIDSLEKQKTQLTGSNVSLEKSHENNSQSKSLSMSVAEHLLFLMKEVTKESADPKSVNAACNCATQMINLMKLNIKLRDH